jgi:hypothetical protein
MSRVTRASFVVRVSQDSRGQVSGVIERVATGGKEAFTSMEAIGPVILGMLPAAHGEKPRLRRPRVQRNHDEGA